MQAGEVLEQGLRALHPDPQEEAESRWTWYGFVKPQSPSL